MTRWREQYSQQKAKRRGSTTESFKDIQKEFGVTTLIVQLISVENDGVKIDPELPYSFQINFQMIYRCYSRSIVINKCGVLRQVIYMTGWTEHDSNRRPSEKGICYCIFQGYPKGIRRSNFLKDCSVSFMYSSSNCYAVTCKMIPEASSLFHRSKNPETTKIYDGEVVDDDNWFTVLQRLVRSRMVCNKVLLLMRLKPIYVRYLWQCHLNIGLFSVHNFGVIGANKEELIMVNAEKALDFFLNQVVSRKSFRSYCHRLCLSLSTKVANNAIMAFLTSGKLTCVAVKLPGRSDDKIRRHWSCVFVGAIPKQDTETADKLTNDCEKEKLYREVASTVETGWDFSTRWLK
ncbi:trehalase [Artemisia annua]|uniref:alpha,alpha-trehalase n=1 Tax=Artemisia annua TaxID=35608 RepID=A0A2U1P2X5_ARTAN|nr:trehalase [Artemisia annua]